MSTQLRELKSRKAKFGFDGGHLSIHNVVEIGKFIGELNVKFSSQQYIAEEAGYHNPEVRIYTDESEVAEWIRNYKF